MFAIFVAIVKEGIKPLQLLLLCTLNALELEDLNILQENSMSVWFRSPEEVLCWKTK